MNIAILGSGNVGKALGLSWAKKNHTVIFGVRDPQSEDSIELAKLENVAVESIPDAVQKSEVILLAIPSKVILELINTLPNLSGKVLFDCSNPASPANHENDRPDISIAEEIAKSASGAHVAKIFNTAGFEVLGNPDFNGTKASMFYSSNDDKASEAAQLLASDAGFDPIHAGALSVSPMLEELTRFWGALAYGQGMGRQIAFKLFTP